jgi:hypothetical protein
MTDEEREEHMERKIILDLCGGTGAWSEPYRKAGYDVRVITLPDFDVLDYSPPENVYGILASPPCTQFSIARNDKTAKKPRDLREGMNTVNACLRIIHECLYAKYRKDGLKFWCLENPATGYLKKFLGKPSMIFEPCDYGDPYTKSTALWGMFNEPLKNPVDPIYGSMVKYASKFKELKPVDEAYRKKLGVDARKIRRSITPTGFANEFFKQNK